MDVIKMLMGVLGAIAMVLLCLLIREIKNRKNWAEKQKEQDRMLTKYVMENLDMKRELADMQDSYKRQQEVTEEVKRVQEQIRLLKHDMKNHTLVMLSYLEEENVKEAKAYAGKLLDKLNKMYSYVNVGNALLSYIMNHKLSEAKERGIEIKAEIENLTFAYMDSVDFSALLNNLLDNAISGALDTEEKKLEVKIISQKGMDVIVVKNSIRESVLETNPTLSSTKEEPGHGFGLKQIRSITEKYDGMLDIYEKNQMFVVSIMFG